MVKKCAKYGNGRSGIDRGVIGPREGWRQISKANQQTAADKSSLDLSLSLSLSIITRNTFGDRNHEKMKIKSDGNSLFYL